LSRTAERNTKEAEVLTCFGDDFAKGPMDTRVSVERQMIELLE